jgi:2-amino-4-hydroxy-6-hydroxymethyldihydropteridine diphosphokinase
VTRAAVALGANLGDRAATLAAAVAEVGATAGVAPVAVSAVYETAAVGGPAGQPAFLNAVLVVETELAAADLLAALHRVEDAHGRVRDVRWGPRTLDLDLLAYGGLVTADPTLTLPHPRAAERAFVLVPWAEVDAGFDVPGLGSVADLLSALPADQVSAVLRVGEPLEPGR